MADERDYDVMKAKVPRTDHEGNDITQHDFGPGGRRREDGPIAGLAYDLEPLDDDEDEDEDSNDGIADDELFRLIAVGILAFAAGVGAVKAVQWLKNKRRARVARGRVDALEEATLATDSGLRPDQLVTPETMDPAAILAEVDTVLDGCRTQMTSAEAQRRLIRLLGAAAFVAQELRDLSHAEIVDEIPTAELESFLHKLSVPWVTDMVNRALEANPSLLDAFESQEFLDWFGGGAADPAGEYLPISNHRVKHALSLAVPDPEAEQPDSERPS